MEIEFTKQQYKVLAQMLFLGRWMSHSYKVEEDKSPFEALEQHVLSHAEKFGMKGVQFSKESGKYYTDGEFEDAQVEDYVYAYDDYNFWEELFGRLADRDFIRKYGVKAIGEMPVEERIKKRHPFDEQYADEVEKHGLERFAVKK